MKPGDLVHRADTFDMQMNPIGFGENLYEITSVENFEGIDYATIWDYPRWKGVEDVKISELKLADKQLPKHYYLHYTDNETIQWFKVETCKVDTKPEGGDLIKLTKLEAKVLEYLIERKFQNVPSVDVIAYAYKERGINVTEEYLSSFHGMYLGNSFRVLLSVLRKKLRITKLQIDTRDRKLIIYLNK